MASDGGIFTFGDASFQGSEGARHLNQPIVGVAVDPATGGYWLVASDGGIFTFGAPFLGSKGGQRLNQPIVGMAPTPDGAGYYLVASDGGIFVEGDGVLEGSAGGRALSAPVVAMAAVPTGPRLAPPLSITTRAVPAGTAGLAYPPTAWRPQEGCRRTGGPRPACPAGYRSPAWACCRVCPPCRASIPQS
ncbi:MAG: hypothetical protein ACRDY0_11530 [Acidimicrobiales bacterium]